jgi:hypothetical protein
MNKGSISYGLYIDNSKFELTYGGYDPARIKEGEKSEGFGLHHFDLIDNEEYSYAVELRDARYGYMSFLRGDAKRAILASSAKFIHVP